MTPLADALIRSTLVLLVGFGAVFVLRHRSAALRHWILAATIASAALAPPLAWILPAWPATAVQTPSAFVFETVPATATSADAAGDAPRLTGSVATAPAISTRSIPLGLIWAVGFAIGAGTLLVHFLGLARISARASRVTEGSWLHIVNEVRREYGIRQAVRILQTPSPDLLATWGLFRPCIFVPAGATRWDEDVIRVVVCHELAHVRRNDWAVQIGADIIRRVFWFQPLMWIACRMLRRESEQACDDVVLGTGVAAPTYASHLLQLARAGRSTYGWAAAVPMARPSTLERRIAAMLNSARNRRALSYRALVVSTLVLSLATFTAAAFHTEQNRTTQLTGTIYDGSGAVLPGVAVTLTDANKGKSEATTDAAGRFQLPAAAGTKYTLEAAVPGFNAFKQELELTSSSEWDRVIMLQVGQLSETVTVSAKREPATQATPGMPQSKPTPVRVGGNVKAPTKIVNVNPVFPPSMRTAGRAGVVPIEALIGTDGSVVFARVLSANAHPDFAAAAIEAVRQWKFSPTLLNGKPVEVIMGVTVNFALE